MTMKIDIKDQYLEQFKALLKTLPEDAVHFDTISDNSISFEEAQNKVENSIYSLSKNKGIALDIAFDKVLNNWNNIKL